MNRPGWMFALVLAATPVLCAVTVAQSSATVAQSSARDTAPAALVDTDRQFLTLVAQAGMTEVQAGALAETHGSADSVKRFGRQMVSDHTAAGKELAGLADRKHFALPATVDSENAQHLATLRGLTGTAFDGPYADMMVKGHEKVVKAFQTAVTGAVDPDIKAFAVNTLPTLTHHLELARRMVVSERSATDTSPRH